MKSNNEYTINIDVSTEKATGTVKLSNEQGVTVPVAIQDNIDPQNIGHNFQGVSVVHRCRRVSGYRCGIRGDD